jgi:hypothetical protein
VRLAENSLNMDDGIKSLRQSSTRRLNGLSGRNGSTRKIRSNRNQVVTI